MTDSDKKIPEKINKWNLVLLATLLVAVIVTGGWFYYNYQASIIKENKHQEIKAISELKLDQIIYWQNERKSDIKVVSNLLSIIKSVELWQATKSDNALANIVDYLESVKETYNYHDILITTPNGELILSLSPEEKSSLAIPHSTIKESAETKNIVFSPLYIHEEKNEIHYDLTAPILDRNNEVLAIMLFRMLPEDYLYPLIHSWPTSDKSAETLIARQESDGVLFLNELRHKKNTTLKLHLPLSRMELPIVQAAKGYRGVWEGKDYRGVEVLSYVSDIPGTPWYMVTKVDETEIYAELNFLAVVVSLFTLFLLILTGAGFAGIYSSRQKNVFKALFLKEKEYSENLEEFRTILYSIGDAVITTDINGRVRELNPRAEKLTGWKKEEAIGENHNVVFRLIDEKTRESLGDPFRMAMAEGKPIDSAKNTALIAKDGVEIPISERAAPINNLDGENIGVVFVFRDQTEERKTQAAILLNEERYRGLFHSIADAILVANTDREIIDCNKGFEKLFGYSKS
ncbi:MAG: PAS domain S-box protein, partial [Melioribacteraceae bacterium]|nr:PAS domain S-box protein [Melioribacteraceae bacterium]